MMPLTTLAYAKTLTMSGGFCFRAIQAQWNCLYGLTTLAQRTLAGIVTN